LFEENDRVRKKMLKYLADSVSNDEYEYFHQNVKENTQMNTDNKVLELLRYAPQPLVEKIKLSLQKIKNITQEF
jgi:RNA polymerase-binding transcription factor DksA